MTVYSGGASPSPIGMPFQPVPQQPGITGRSWVSLDGMMGVRQNGEVYPIALSPFTGTNYLQPTYDANMLQLPLSGIPPMLNAVAQVYDTRSSTTIRWFLDIDGGLWACPSPAISFEQVGQSKVLKPTWCGTIPISKTQPNFMPLILGADAKAQSFYVNAAGTVEFTDLILSPTPAETERFVLAFGG